MADTMLRPGAAKAPDHASDTARPRIAGAKPRLLVGAAFAVWTAAAGVAGLCCLTLAAWVTAAHHGATPRPALATGVQVWLLAQHTGLGLSGGSFGLVPISVTALLGLLLVRAGRHTARLSGARDRYDCVATALAVALPYAVIAALLTRPAESGQVRPVPLQALSGAFVLAIICAGIGALRETGQAAGLFDLMPHASRSVGRAALAAVVVVVATGAVLFGVGLSMHLHRATSLTTAVHGGLPATVVMIAISIAYLPNAIVWAAAVSLGPGFAVGTHTSVALGGVHLGAVPSLPLLAPLPGSGPLPTVAWVAIAGPILAGVVAGWLTARSAATPTTIDRQDRQHVDDAARGVAAGICAGVGLAAMAWLSAGSLAPGRMSFLGPSAWQVGLAAAAEIGAVAGVVAWAAGWRRAGNAASLLPPRDAALDTEPGAVPDGVPDAEPDAVSDAAAATETVAEPAADVSVETDAESGAVPD